MSKKNPSDDAAERLLEDLETLRERDWTMEALAEETGVGIATISRWCRGGTYPSRGLVKMAGPVLARLVKR